MKPRLESPSEIRKGNRFESAESQSEMFYNRRDVKLSLCNEVLREFPFPEQCRLARDFGYDGLEIAPFTLDENPHLIPPYRARKFHRVAADSGISITSLHWLLAAPAGLSINSPDAFVRGRTVEVLQGLIELCSELGARTIVHGSPKQRSYGTTVGKAQAEALALETFRAIATEVEAAAITYCIEPLSPQETNFLNTVEESIRFCQRIGSPAFRTMLDTRAARSIEQSSVEELFAAWYPKGWIAHVHLNDRNRRGPGQGDDPFAPLLAEMHRQDYQEVVVVEPFDYFPDGPGAASYCAGYLRGIFETLAPRGLNGASNE
ncbi:MAG TPA: sugar phosphate isomerase/epimerase family protein [Acidobacteriota bacterium]|nr:sugar phosphate isomerase/epimerase family protein [Acidobacteriota bacterium]